MFMERLRLLATKFELQSPPMRRIPRFTPQFQRADLRETGSEPDHQALFAHSASITQHCYQRRVMVYIRFVQSHKFAMRVVPSSRTEQAKGDRPVRQN